MKLNEIKQLNENSFPTDRNEIEKIISDLKIASLVCCTIHPNGVVDINNDVHLSNRKLTKFPIRFGKVTGRFLCENNNLMSLEGGPVEVEAGFYCNDNKLTSLEFAPKRAGDGFYCKRNLITSLEGISDIFDSINFLLHIDGSDIVKGGLGLVLIKDLQNVKIQFKDNDAQSIIKKYLGRPDDIFDCQNELIEAGLEEYAQL